MTNQQILQEVIIQVCGFAVVFWVLKKFAFGQLMGAIDKRRTAIADTFSDLEKQKKGLQALEDQYKQKLAHIEEEARAKIQEASRLGADLSKDIQDKARADAQKLIDRARAEIEQDLMKAKLSLRNEVAELSTELTEKALKIRMTAEDHKRLVNDFIKDLEKVQPHER